MGGQTIFFGANDACLPEQPQHVPLDRYSENLKLLCLHPSVVAHDDVKIILVTPPPVNEYQLEEVIGFTTLRRTAAHTKKYADACREAAEKLDLPVVDLWQAFMSKAGWKEGEPLTGSRDLERNEVLDNLLRDGMPSFQYR
jgi:isoamyl acetate esterase